MIPTCLTQLYEVIIGLVPTFLKFLLAAFINSACIDVYVAIQSLFSQLWEVVFLAQVFG